MIDMTKIPIRVGERFSMPDAPAPWCNFTYEVTRIKKETVSIRVVK